MFKRKSFFAVEENRPKIWTTDLIQHAISSDHTVLRGPEVWECQTYPSLTARRFL